jgi:hypothetical protein
LVIIVFLLVTVFPFLELALRLHSFGCCAHRFGSSAHAASEVVGGKGRRAESSIEEIVIMIKQ